MHGVAYSERELDSFIRPSQGDQGEVILPSRVTTHASQSQLHQEFSETANLRMDMIPECCQVSRLDGGLGAAIVTLVEAVGEHEEQGARADRGGKRAPLLAFKWAVEVHVSLIVVGELVIALVADQSRFDAEVVFAKCPSKYEGQKYEDHVEAMEQ